MKSHFRNRDRKRKRRSSDRWTTIGATWAQPIVPGIDWQLPAGGALDSSIQKIELLDENSIREEEEEETSSPATKIRYYLNQTLNCASAKVEERTLFGISAGDRLVRRLTRANSWDVENQVSRWQMRDSLKVKKKVVLWLTAPRLKRTGKKEAWLIVVANGRNDKWKEEERLNSARLLRTLPLARWFFARLRKSVLVLSLSFFP